MSRDSNGNYELPIGNPVVSGTTIDTEWANPTMTDLAIAMQDSLSRTGKGGMQVPLKHVNGTVTAPAMTFTSEPKTGFYRASAGDLRASVNGVDRMRWTSEFPEVWDVDDQVWYDVVTTKGNIGTETETHTLEDGQVSVTFVSALGGAGFIINGYDADNGRLLANVDYILDTDNSIVTLTDSYPAGTTLTAVKADITDGQPVENETLTIIARSLNVLNSQVIYSTDTTTILDDVLYIYDAGVQVIWSAPELNGTGETIVSVTGSTLETTGGTYALTTASNQEADVFINVVGMQSSQFDFQEGKLILIGQGVFKVTSGATSIPLTNGMYAQPINEIFLSSFVDDAATVTNGVQFAFDVMVDEQVTLVIDASYTVEEIRLRDNWINIDVRSSYSGVAYAGFEGNALTFTTGGITIPLVNNNHYRCAFTGVSLVSSDRTNSAWKFEIDGTRDFNYPIKWFFDDCNTRSWENTFEFVRTGGALDPDGFFGTTVINRLNTFSNERTVLFDGVYANLFYFRDCRLHSGNEHIRFAGGSGGFIEHTNVHFEGVNINNTTSLVVFEDGFLQSSLSFHNFDWENCGNFISVPSTATSTPRLVFTGMNRFNINSYLIQPQKFGAVSVANYSDRDMIIIPSATIIETPDTIRVKDNDGDGSLLTHYYVPTDKANNTVMQPLAQPLAGQNNYNAASTGGVKDYKYPFISSINTRYYGTNVAIDRTPNVTDNSNFVCAVYSNFVQNSTRLGNPITVSIGGSSEQFYLLPFQGTTGDYVAVLQFELGTGVNIANLQAILVSGGGINSIGYGFFTEKETTSASKLLPPKGYKISASVAVPDGSSAGIDLRGASAQQVHAKGIGKLSGGIGCGEWMSNGTASTAGAKQIAEIANINNGNGSISGSVGINYELMRVAGTNNSGADEVLDVTFEIL